MVATRGRGKLATLLNLVAVDGCRAHEPSVLYLGERCGSECCLVCLSGRRGGSGRRGSLGARGIRARGGVGVGHGGACRVRREARVRVLKRSVQEASGSRVEFGST